MKRVEEQGIAASESEFAAPSRQAVSWEALLYIVLVSKYH
jgi:hypothetical protein